MYDAFENRTVCEEEIANRFGYAGEQYDEITQQYYLRARFYNPVIGRFTQEDTYYGDGLNLYEYGRNNPVRYIDPSGHEVRAAAEKNYVNRAVNAMNRTADQGVDGMLERVYGGTEGGSSTKGYSKFADGMSPEDAARYIKNNEEKFFGEFSERAGVAGLNSNQIAEAYNAMKQGDYTKMASYFDTNSPTDGAVFWSGNKDGAAGYANGIGGTIMEQTPGGQVFDNWRGLQGMYPEWETGATPQKPIWTALSSQYAKGASGNVTYVVKEGYNNSYSVWKTVELPILQNLQDEGIVTDISTAVIGE